MTRKLFIVGAGLLLTAGVALAHHAYAAEFDLSKPVKLTGVVTRVEWTNPHIWIYIDVKDETGKVTNWGFSPEVRSVHRFLVKRSRAKSITPLAAARMVRVER